MIGAFQAETARDLDGLARNADLKCGSLLNPPGREKLRSRDAGDGVAHSCPIGELGKSMQQSGVISRRQPRGDHARVRPDRSMASPVEGFVSIVDQPTLVGTRADRAEATVSSSRNTVRT